MNEPVVLGVCSGTHDSAAALIVGGEFVGLVEEERLCGIKHTNARPDHAIAALLARAGIAANAVTHVAYNFEPGAYRRGVWSSLPYLSRPATARRAVPRARSFARVSHRAKARVTDIRHRLPSATVHGTDHHLAHGLYAFAASDYTDAGVLIVDSLGETVTTSIARAHQTGSNVYYRTLRQISDPASLGYAYGAVTEHLGWQRGDEEGTVMALAAHGDPARFRTVLAEAIRISGDRFALDPKLLALRVISSRYPRVTPEFVARTCSRRSLTDPVVQVHADLAAALQERTEQVMLHLARTTRHLTGAPLLCVGGGVAMNCVAIGRIAAEASFDEVAVPPAPGDSGTAAGAAISSHLEITGTLPSGVAGRCYLGPSYDGPPPTPRPGLTMRHIDDAAELAARKLATGAIVGVFRGRLEAGPRALGNRSILASPLETAVVDRLNTTVKFREPFRPFAPVVLADKAADYFTLGQASPFMSIASGVTDLARSTIPSIVHVNATARVQTVSHEQNRFLAEVLAHFADITGVPVLINTSLNVKGKPICGTPEMALDCLTESGLDALLLGDWWVTKT